MINFAGKIVSECGWAGPLLWVVTQDDFSIHLYDGRIHLDGARVETGDDVNSRLSGKTIEKIAADRDGFRVLLAPGIELKVERSGTETARVFKRGDLGPHCIYQNGVLSEDAD